jgi:beta-lactamase class A
VALAIAAALGVTLAACSAGSSAPENESPSSSTTTSPSSSATTTTNPRTEAAWAEIERRLSALGPNVGFLAASVASDGMCHPLHQVAPTTARPTASQFKLFVLGALAEKIAAGEITWDQTVTVAQDTMSLGNEEGSLQFAEPGSTVSVEEAATKMISISDNTAADMLIGLVGRDDVEAQADQWMADASANNPFLTTQQMLLLHYVPGLADRYLATPQDQRADFLATSVDPLPVTDIGTGYTTEPRYIDEVEWFASPTDICGAFAGLQELSTDPDLAPLSTVLSRQVAGIGLNPTDWPTVWYKGGSEAGVLTLGWLATNSQGDTFAVQAMVSNPDAALSEDSITDLVALAQDAFALVA